MSDFLWACKLDRNCKEVVFNSNMFDDGLAHSLLLKRAILEPSGNDREYEVNIVEIETTGHSKEIIKETLLCLARTRKQNYATDNIELAVPGPVVLRLTQGAGPITIFGQHLIENIIADESEEEDKDDISSAESEAAAKVYGIEDKNLTKTKDETETEKESFGKKRRRTVSVSSLPEKVRRLEKLSASESSSDETEDENSSSECEEESNSSESGENYLNYKCSNKRDEEDSSPYESKLSKKAKKRKKKSISPEKVKKEVKTVKKKS